MGNLMLAAHSLGVLLAGLIEQKKNLLQKVKALLKQWGIEGDYIGVVDLVCIRIFSS